MIGRGPGFIDGAGLKIDTVDVMAGTGRAARVIATTETAPAVYNRIMEHSALRHWNRYGRLIAGNIG